MASIHQLASVSPRAEIADDVVIGPFCVVEDDVVIGPGCRLEAHAVVKSGTSLGSRNHVAEGAVLGGLPQHRQSRPRFGRLVIGDDNAIREMATLHRALEAEAATRVGNDTLIMINAHVGHDCTVEDGCILAGNVLLAGHVHVHEHAYLSGAVGVHQFCRIGRLAMVGGQAHVTRDVPPFMLVDGESTMIVGLNQVGLRRRGFDRRELAQLKAAYRVLYRQHRTWDEILETLAGEFPEGPAAELQPFLAQAQRGIVQERRTPPPAVVPLPQASPESPRLRRAG